MVISWSILLSYRKKKQHNPQIHSITTSIIGKKIEKMSKSMIDSSIIDLSIIRELPGISSPKPHKIVEPQFVANHDHIIWPCWIKL